MAGFRKQTGGKKTMTPEGQLRQSQLVTTFGPGAMVDLVDRSVIIGGLEHWAYGKEGYKALDDARLRRALIPKLKALDPDLDLAKDGYFRMAPAGDMKDATSAVGVRALEFPRWFVCQNHDCRRLARAYDAFENKKGRYQHECSKGRFSKAIPVRFVTACKRGHLSDFPWVAFAHLGPKDSTCDRPELVLIEQALGDVARIHVRCTNCNASQPMSAASNLPFRCNGDRPWLGGNAASEKDCDQTQQLLVRSASNAYFSQVVSALRLPDPKPDELRVRLREKELWKAVGAVTAIEELAFLFKLQPHVKAALAAFAPDKVLAAIKAENEAEASIGERPLRSAEYDRLTSAEIELPGSVPPKGVEFAAYRVPAAKLDAPAKIAGLVVVPELREVRVQLSFSRIDSISPDLQGEFDPAGRRVKPAVLTMPTGNEKWLPAAEVRGEGVFIEIDQAALAEWEQRDAVRARAEMLLKAFEGNGGAAGDFPGIRFYLLHSLSHLLLTAISLECGYAASAIRERIYCGKPEVDGPTMAAVMLMTGTTGSEGTLGGLVEEGRRLRHHLREAWDLGRLCSNDPVCAAHDPSAEASDRRTEGAACHGCLYVAEPCCERFNRFLDRALVVPTIGNDLALAFFDERP